mgnify:CR=1 FL=1
MGEYERINCKYKFKPESEAISNRPAVQANQARPSPAIQKSGSVKRVVVLILAFIMVFSLGLILGYGIGLSNVYTKAITIIYTTTEGHTVPQTVTVTTSTSMSTSLFPVGQPSEVITLREIKVHAKPERIDSVRIYYSIRVRNNIDKKISYQAILRVNGKELMCEGKIDPYKEDECSKPYYRGIRIDRPVGVRELRAELVIVNSSETSELFARKELKIDIPAVKIGEVIPPEKIEPLFFVSEDKNIQVKIISLIESKKACEGPYVYYVRNASEGMKFIILKVNFTNVGKRIARIPTIIEGEIRTNTGNIYPGSNSLTGKGVPLWREASEEELETICPIHEKSELLQGESSIVHMIFEIRESEEPVEAFIENIPYIIVFQD